MDYKVTRTPAGYDSDLIECGKGNGFIPKSGEDKGRVFMKRCFKCGRENYAPAVMTGSCAWCEYSANETREGG